MTSRSKNVAPEIVVDELELEDSNDVSSESEEEQEIADMPEEQMPGPSSRPGALRISFHERSLGLFDATFDSSQNCG